MARNNFHVSTQAEVTLTAASTKTVLALIAPTSQGVAVKSATISFNGSSSSVQEIIVELVRFAADGTGTAVTPSKKFSGTDTLRTTAKKNYTVEPTTPEILAGFEVNAQAGVQYPFPLDGEVIAKGGEVIGIRVTTPTGVNPNCYANFECEE